MCIFLISDYREDQKDGFNLVDSIMIKNSQMKI
jgi:hypothetical protein